MDKKKDGNMLDIHDIIIGQESMDNIYDINVAIEDDSHTQISLEEKKNFISRAIRAIKDEYNINNKSLKVLKKDIDIAAASLQTTMLAYSAKLKSKYTGEEYIGVNKYGNELHSKIGALLELYNDSKFDAELIPILKEKFTNYDISADLELLVNKYLMVSKPLFEHTDNKTMYIRDILKNDAMLREVLDDGLRLFTARPAGDECIFYKTAVPTVMFEEDVAKAYKKMGVVQYLTSEVITMPVRIASLTTTSALSKTKPTGEMYMHDIFDLLDMLIGVCSDMSNYTTNLITSAAAVENKVKKYQAMIFKLKNITYLMIDSDSDTDNEFYHLSSTSTDDDRLYANYSTIIKICSNSGRMAINRIVSPIRNINSILQVLNKII